MAAVEKRILIRMRKELKDLETSPPLGVICYPQNDNIVHLQAELTGPADTPYEGGVFKIDIHIPEKYPFEPPRCQFLTRVYHPNIDDQGRICLDILKGPPKGTWGPAISITTMLLSLRILLANPNPDDPLLVEIANEFKENRALFTQRARMYTKQYAMGDADTIGIEKSSEILQPSDQPNSFNISALQELVLRPTFPSTPSESTSSSSSTTSSTTQQPSAQKSPASDSFSTPSTISTTISLDAAEKKTLSRPTLKKPSLKSKRASATADPIAPSFPDPEINSAASSQSPAQPSAVSEVSQSLGLSSDVQIVEKEEEEAVRLVGSRRAVSPVHVVIRAPDTLRSPFYPSPEDTIADKTIDMSKPTRELDTVTDEKINVSKREPETETSADKIIFSLDARQELNTAVEEKIAISKRKLESGTHTDKTISISGRARDSDTTMSMSELFSNTAAVRPVKTKRAKSEKAESTRPKPKPKLKSRPKSSPLEKASLESRAELQDSLQDHSQPLSQPSRTNLEETYRSASQQKNDAPTMDTNTHILTPTAILQKNRSSEQSPSKESAGRITNAKRNQGPLQPVQPQLVQSRSFSAENIGNSEESVLQGVARENDKGKGRAVMDDVPGRNQGRTLETDENARVVSLPLLSKAGSFEKGITVPSSSALSASEFRSDKGTEATPLLTVARKRSLLKKQRPT